MQQVDTRRAKQRETVETLSSLARAATQELLLYRDSLSQKERLLAEYKATITQFDQTIEYYYISCLSSFFFIKDA
jgi:hypothetical protein